MVAVQGKDRRWDKDLERIGKLPGEVKVQMAIEMTEFCVRVCADGIRAQNPGITEEKLLEKLRERVEWSKRWQKR